MYKLNQTIVNLQNKISSLESQHAQDCDAFKKEILELERVRRQLGHQLEQEQHSTRTLVNQLDVSEENIEKLINVKLVLEKDLALQIENEKSFRSRIHQKEDEVYAIYIYIYIYLVLNYCILHL